MNIARVKIVKPEGANIIFGQSHFIKTVEDLYEAVICSVPGIRFGLAFCEASGPCLVRSAGNDKELELQALDNAMAIGAGHSFIIIFEGAFPINIIRAVKSVPEVCSIYCATANPVEVIMAETEQGKAVIGIVDGNSPKGKESERDKQDRKQFLRDIGYKL
ncbi:MAG: adenosine-specific kinase [Candidatus Omnitrophica bacterium]|jgi:hypothetical protein|nr:adenosine-specific kinase [Candidatus Omnitrophota bacterium]